MKAERFLTMRRLRAAFTGGWRIGIVVPCLMLAATVVSPAQEQPPTPETVTFTTLVNFNGMDGRNPGGMIQGPDGALYGTTGGANGDGTFFRMTPGGSLTKSVRYAGSTPGISFLGTDGNFYGTGGGGAFANGAVYKIATDGTLTVLYSFCAMPNCPDGSNPFGLALGRDGNFYGTTGSGGTGTDCGFGTCGTAFQLTPGGTLTTLYDFCSQPGCSDGSLNFGGVIQASDGNIYGTTNEGGNTTTGCGSVGCGTVFKLTPTGVFTTIYSFCPTTSSGDCLDGARPTAGLVQGSDGALYGTTQFGGANCVSMGGCGVVFRVTTAGAYSTVYSFCAQASCADGANPSAGLIQADDGNLYGTTLDGGIGVCSVSVYEPGCGTVFSLTPGGTLTTLHQFVGTDGTSAGTPVQDTSGSLYGTANAGGASSSGCPRGCGTVFEVSAGLKPFVEPVPSSGKVGATIQILGTNLTSATAVSFNGVAAAFTVVSASEITATVPAGATTGYMTVVTAKRTLRSSVKFRVLP